MNTYRIKVWEWDGSYFSIKVKAESSVVANNLIFHYYRNAPAHSEPVLIEGVEPKSKRWWEFWK